MTDSHTPHPVQWEPDEIEDFRSARSDEERLAMLKQFGVLPHLRDTYEALVAKLRRPDN